MFLKGVRIFLCVGIFQNRFLKKVIADQKKVGSLFYNKKKKKWLSTPTSQNFQGPPNGPNVVISLLEGLEFFSVLGFLKTDFQKKLLRIKKM